MRDGHAAGREAVAIVGLACRLPAAPDVAAFRTLLRSGRPAFGPAPPDRAEVAADHPGFRAGWLDDIYGFDASFFGIAPVEASSMDPQQRLFLECAWRALEDSGLSRDHVAGSRTGVFAGVSGNDYARLLAISGAPVDRYFGSGNAASIIANRLSYFFDLHGPSLAVDTACSSALTAVHLACDSLRNGESDIALAGGANALLAPDLVEAFTAARMLSPDGRCRVFDAGANGYVRGEGAGVVALMRLSDALNRNMRVRAVILGSALNQDGRTNGLTAPNGLSQQAVIRGALAAANLDADAVGLIEAHGTGTPLGDPIEVNALKAIYGRNSGGPVPIGSAKALVGHLEAAAGAVGLIKAVLQVEHGEIYPVPEFADLNPLIKLNETRLRVADRLETWDSPNRLAAVSAFGFGGANAHLIIGNLEPAPPVRLSDGPLILSFSARSPSALAELATAMADQVEDTDDSRVAALCVAANTTRSAFEFRRAIVAADAAGLGRALRIPQPVRRATAREVAFLFTGQGSQHADMAHGLYVAEPDYRARLLVCAEILQRRCGFDLETALATGLAGAGQARTDLAQPALCALQVSLAGLLMGRGVRPAAVLGHSVGEIAAAHVAGVLSLEDALVLATARGRLVQELAGPGAMAAVFAASDVTSSILSAHPDVSLASDNGAAGCVISGSGPAVAAALEAFNGLGVSARVLDVGHGFHSALMDPVLPAFAAAISELAFQPPDVPFFSTVSGREDQAVGTSAYWPAQLRAPVRFSAAFAAMTQPGRVFVEIGPRPHLSNLIARMAPDATSAPVLDGRRDDSLCLANALGVLFEAGVDVDWRAHHGAEVRIADLPGHPFHRRRHAAFDPERPFSSPHGAAPPRARSDMLFEETWTSEAPASHTAEANLLIIGRHDTGRALASGLEARGHTVHQAMVGRAFADLGSGRWIIDPAKPEDLRRLIEGWMRLAPVGRPLCVLYDCGAPEENVGDGRAHLDDLAVRSFGYVNLINALSYAARPARAWALTWGAAGASGRATRAGEAAFWGLARSAAWEAPAHVAGVLDIEPGADDPAGAIGEAVTSATPALVRRLEGGLWRVPRLRPLEQNLDPAAQLSLDGACLITGGLGALGLRLAGWAAAAGARRLILTGRNPPSEAAHEEIGRLRRRGVEVEAVQVDVTDAGAMPELFARQRGAGVPVRSVFHLAGLLRDATLSGLSPDMFAAALAPKLGGLSNLAAAMRPGEVELFVAFSSLAAVTGSPGQASYAAANAALRGVAPTLTSVAGRVVCVDWGPWAETGMAARDVADAAGWGRLGIDPLIPDEALQALAGAILAPTDAVVAASADWGRLAGLAPPGAADLLAAFTAGATVVDAGAVRRGLLAPTSGDPRAAILAWITEAIAATLGETAQLGDDSRLGDVGLDSLGLLEVRTRLSRAVDLPLDLDAFLGGAPLAELAASLETQLLTAQLFTPPALEDYEEVVL